MRYGRNFLFHGPPRTGKTALIEALSGIFNAAIYRVSLASLELTDDDLIILLSRVRSGSFVLFEDIDRANLPTRRIASHAEKITGTPSKGYPQLIQTITLSGFPNAIDGVATPERLIVIFTTNYPEDLNPAIVRPGRVDKIMRLGLASRGQIRFISFRIYSSESILKTVLETKA